MPKKKSKKSPSKKVAKKPKVKKKVAKIAKSKTAKKTSPVQKTVKKEKNLTLLLKEVISIVAGKQSEEIVDLLHSKSYVNEFLISKKLDITINQTRNILYKIADHGLVSNTRKKDKKKGWYTYFWKIEVLKSLEFLKGFLQKRISQTANQINSRETKRFYVCERCGIELGEENALLYDFTCQECGAIFTLKDNTKLLKELERHLAKYKEEMEMVEAEIEIEAAKIEKAKEKERGIRKKEAKAKRAATRKKNAAKRAAAKKTNKKPKKKSVKKKPAKKKAKTKKSTAKKPVKKKTSKKVKKPTKKKKKVAKKKPAKKKGKK